jgi:aerobic carbon-monoxide dehydrogenase small subunit
MEIPMRSSHISFSLNGQPTELLVEPGKRLLDVLRDQCGATGTRNGCAQGTCGACTVHVDGTAMLACLTLAERIDGAEITTIEGLAKGNALHALQQAFVTENAVQCGYCTSGMIMAAKALLDRVPNPSREQVVDAISGNVCRCTGYDPIIAAVLSAASALAAPAIAA